MRLVRVELRRLFTRKMVWLALVAGVALVLAALYGVHQQASWVDESRATAQQMLEETREHWVAPSEAEVQMCLDEEERTRQNGDPEADFACEEMSRPPQIEDFYGSMPPMVDLYTELLSGLAYPFLFLVLAVGSTHIAAEFAHRTMGSWLTFVPRRVPVFVSKVLAAGLGALPVVGVALALILVGIPAVLRFHGIDDGLTRADWSDVAWMALRVALLAVAAGMLGSCLAFLVRHSGVVIGLVVGYLLVAEGLLRGVFPQLTSYLLSINLDAVVRDGTIWEEYPVNCDDITVSCRPIVHEVSLTHGVVVLAVLLAVLGGLALLRFRTSDID